MLVNTMHLVITQSNWFLQPALALFYSVYEAICEQLMVSFYLCL